MSLSGLDNGRLATGMLGCKLRSKRMERDGEDKLDTGEVESDGKSTGSEFGEETDNSDVS